MNIQISSPLQGEPAIRVKNLSKVFKIYARPLDMVRELLTSKPRHRPFRALDDISFDVQKGQVVGLLGRNGAGKSTLLRIIAGTLDASSGHISVNGRISSILELGTGFNREYSGRENIFMGGLIAGLSVDEIKEKEDWIIEFSELKDFIDQPFKTYSSGMQARLTFSTAICIDPDILIVDEALSVGDARFQRKSFGKMKEFREAGKTILFVSHDINTLSVFCDDIIWLEQGRVYERGEPQHISKSYYKKLFSGDTPVQMPQKIEAEPNNLAVELALDLKNKNNDHPHRLLREMALSKLNLDKSYVQNNSHMMRMGNGKAEILDYGILDDKGNKIEILESGKAYILFFRAVYYEDVWAGSAGFLIRDLKGVDVFGVTLGSLQVPIPSRNAGEVVEIRIHVNMWLANGIYFLTLNTADPYATDNVQFDSVFDGYQFEVSYTGNLLHSSIVNLEPRLEILQIN